MADEDKYKDKKLIPRDEGWRKGASPGKAERVVEERFGERGFGGPGLGEKPMEMLSEDEQEARLRRDAAWFDLTPEERGKEMLSDNKKNPPWAAGVNPWKEDDAGWGISPKEFLDRVGEAEIQEAKGPFAFFINVAGIGLYKGMKVKVPVAGGEAGEFELTQMNKYNDPYNYPTTNVHPAPTMKGKHGNSVGFGGDVRGAMIHTGLTRSGTEHQMIARNVRGAHRREIYMGKRKKLLEIE